MKRTRVSNKLVSLVLLALSLVEAPGAFGSQRPLDLVRIYRQAPSRQIVDNLYFAVRAFSRNQPQYDDITATVLKVNAEVAQPASP